MVFDVAVPPPAEETPHGSAAPEIVLELRNDGTYAINGAPIERDALETRLTQLYRDWPARSSS